MPLPPVARRSFREDGTDLMVAKVHGEHRSIEDTKITQASNRSQATPRDPCGGEQPLVYDSPHLSTSRREAVVPLLRKPCEDRTPPARILRGFDHTCPRERPRHRCIAVCPLAHPARHPVLVDAAMRFRHLGHNQARSGPDARFNPRHAPARRCSDDACRRRQRRVPQIMVIGCEARLPWSSNGPR